MKKFNFSAFIVLVCFILFHTSNIYAQRWVSTKVEKRKVVLEEFTGIHCGFCPDGHKLANNLAKNNPGNVFLVNIHAGGYATPGSGEVDLRVDDATSLMQNMGVSTFPSGSVNRELVNTGQKTEWVLNRGYWEYVSSLILKEDAPVNIAVKARLNPDTRKLTAEVELYYTADCQANNYITVMLTQDSILGTQGGAENLYPENIDKSTGKYIHSHVLRKILSDNGFKGDPVTVTKKGTYVYRKYEWDLPTVINTIPVNVKNMHVVAHVTSSTGLNTGMPLKAYNAAGTTITESAGEETDKLILVEEFTNANSAKSAELNITDGLNQYLQSNTSKVIPIVYHAADVTPDPMNEFDNVFPYQRGINYYGSKEVPAVFVDGVKVTNNTKAAVESAVTSAVKSSYVTITPDFSIVNNKVNVKVKVKSEVQYTNLALRVAVLEAGVFYPKETGLAGNNGEEEFYFVARYMLPDATGSKFGIEANGTREFNLSKDIDVSVLDKDKLYVVVFVQNEDNKKVLQTAITKNLAFVSIDVAQSGNTYSMVNKGTEKTHVFEVTNKSSIPINVMFKAKTSQENWDYSTPVPNTATISADSKKNINYGITANTDKAEAFVSSYDVEIIDCTLPSNFGDGIVVYGPSKNVKYIDVTNNSKYAYLYDPNDGDAYLANKDALENAAAFENSLATIPVYESTKEDYVNMLDNFDFVGITINKNNYKTFINDNASVFNALSNLINNGKKVFVSANQLLELVNDKKTFTNAQTKIINDFYKTQYGVASVDEKSNIETPVEIVGVDETITKDKYTLFEGEAGYYTDCFSINNSNITSGIFKTNNDKVVAVKSTNAYDNTKNRRLLLGFDLAGIKQEERRSLANNLINWLYAGVSSIENDIAGNSNLELNIFGNPINSDSRIILNNNDDNAVMVNVYLTDINGVKVLDNIFNGLALSGSNYLFIDHNLLASGKYILTAENKNGRVSIPVLISK